MLIDFYCSRRGRSIFPFHANREVIKWSFLKQNSIWNSILNSFIHEVFKNRIYFGRTVAGAVTTAAAHPHLLPCSGICQCGQCHTTMGYRTDKLAERAGGRAGRKRSQHIPGMSWQSLNPWCYYHGLFAIFSPVFCFSAFQCFFSSVF